MCMPHGHGFMGCMCYPHHPSTEEEIEMLEYRKKMLEAEIARIGERIKRLKKGE